MILLAAVFRSPSLRGSNHFLIWFSAALSYLCITWPALFELQRLCTVHSLYDPLKQKRILLTSLFVDHKNKHLLSLTVKLKRAVMQHRLLCSLLGGLAHSKLNECELKGQLDCSHGLSMLWVWMLKCNRWRCCKARCYEKSRECLYCCSLNLISSYSFNNSQDKITKPVNDISAGFCVLGNRHTLKKLFVITQKTKHTA